MEAPGHCYGIFNLDCIVCLGLWELGKLKWTVHFFDHLGTWASSSIGNIRKSVNFPRQVGTTFETTLAESVIRLDSSF